MRRKNALGRVPGLNSDLLDIKSNYFDKGDMFWLALDNNNRVIGSVGYCTNDNEKDVTLHRLFVKCNLKRQGIGTALLNTAENYIKAQGKQTVFLNLGAGKEWFESKSFYTKHGYVEYKTNRMKKIIIRGELCFIQSKFHIC